MEMTVTKLSELLIYIGFGCMVIGGILYIIFDLIKSIGNTFNRGSVAILAAFIILLILLAFIYVGTDMSPLAFIFHDALKWHKYVDGVCTICGAMC